MFSRTWASLPLAVKRSTLAWVQAQGADIVPIPGTKRRVFLEENLGAETVTLTAAELARIAEAAPKGVAVGARY